MPASGITDYGALSGLQRLIGCLVSLATSIFVSWVRKDKSGVASAYVGQAQKISIIATAVFLEIVWGFWTNSSHLPQLSLAAGTGIVACLLAYLVNIWVVERSKKTPKTGYILAFIATYVLYMFAGSSGLSSAGLFATVVLGNSANVLAAVNNNTYDIQIVLQGTRDAPGLFTQPLLGPAETQNKIVNENQKALVSFSQMLETHLSKVDDMGAIGSRSLKMMEGSSGQFAVAKDRFERFIHQSKQGNLATTPASINASASRQLVAKSSG